MSNKRLLLAASTLAPGDGGIGRVARLMTRVLSEEQAAGRFDLEVLSFGGVDDTICPNIRMVGVGRSRLRYLYELHSAGLRHTHFLFDSLGMERARCPFPPLRRPSLAWYHGIEVWENARRARLNSARRTEYLVVNTEYTRTRAEKLHGGFLRSNVCWLATETDESPTIPEQSDKQPTVLILGRMDRKIGEEKGHCELIESWPRVVESVPDARLLIVGKGVGLERYKQIAAASTAKSQIEFLGFVPDEEMENLWAQTTVFAMPSRGEGFGLVYIEAMRHGIPVIASIHDAGQEVNIDGETGYNVDLDDANQLSDRLIELLGAPSRAAALGANGQRRWNEHFRYSNFKARFLPLLNDFLDA